MRTSSWFVTAALFLGACVSLLSGAGGDLAGWQITGAVSIDETRRGPDGTPSFKLGPAATAGLRLRENDGSGKVTFYVYDDGTAAVSEKKVSAAGPRWGLRQADGRVLAGGVMYARYLTEGGSLTLVETGPAGAVNWFGRLRYIGKRAPGWIRWDFDFDPERGVTISVNGKLLGSKQFDWNTSEITGFTDLVLYGDDTRSPAAQTLWVAGIDYSLGGPMKVAPLPPPPPPPILPEADPAPQGDVPAMVESVRGRHPRLLLSEATLPSLRAFYRSETGAPWRSKIEAYLPACNPPEGTAFLTDATDGQRQGLWRLPTVALHYLMTGDPHSLRRAKGFLEKFQALPDWELGAERNSGMSAANIMIGAALAYDWLYADLSPEFRAAFRDTLLRHARLMYYGGHLKRNPGTHYWQHDPGNNHRWHRNAGLILSVLAIYEDKPDERWILQQAVNELAFVNRWLPDDGTSHEGPAYLTFGGNHLLLAMQAADDCLGTGFLAAPYYQNVGLFRTHLLLPGFADTFPFGDGSGTGGYNNFFQKTADLNGQAAVKDALMRMLEQKPRSFEHGWFSLLWDNPGLPRGDVGTLPVASFWPDIGTAIMRDSWREDAVAAMFRCGPFGGYKLNEFRNAKTDGGYNYINVAHDDPDANEFTLAIGDTLVVDSDGYSTRKSSHSHNTILVNGLGQMTKGRPEGQKWSQPGGGDMSKMAVITVWKDAGRVVIAEGEASGSYLAFNDKKSGAARPGLDRFRRMFVWVRGDYILVLDDIRAPEPVEISWLIQGGELSPADEQAGRFVLGSAGRTCEFQIVSDRPLVFSIAASPAENRGKPLGLRQLTASATQSTLCFASVYNPWQKKSLGVRLGEPGVAGRTIEVQGDGFTDIWTWEPGASRFDPSVLSASRKSSAGKIDVLLPATPANRL